MLTQVRRTCTSRPGSVTPASPCHHFLAPARCQPVTNFLCVSPVCKQPVTLHLFQPVLPPLLTAHLSARGVMDDTAARRRRMARKAVTQRPRVLVLNCSVAMSRSCKHCRNATGDERATAPVAGIKTSRLPASPRLVGPAASPLTLGLGFRTWRRSQVCSGAKWLTQRTDQCSSNECFSCEAAGTVCSRVTPWQPVARTTCHSFKCTSAALTLNNELCP